MQGRKGGVYGELEREISNETMNAQSIFAPSPSQSKLTMAKKNKKTAEEKAAAKAARSRLIRDAAPYGLS